MWLTLRTSWGDGAACRALRIRSLSLARSVAPPMCALSIAVAAASPAPVISRYYSARGLLFNIQRTSVRTTRLALPKDNSRRRSIDLNISLSRQIASPEESLRSREDESYENMLFCMQRYLVVREIQPSLYAARDTPRTFARSEVGFPRCDPSRPYRLNFTSPELSGWI